MSIRWRGWLAAVAATGLACALIALDVADSAIRRWWVMHAFTTDAIAGLVVLLITVLVADQVLRLRQIKNRSVATAAQAAILMAQAGRSSRAVSAVLDGSGDRDAASGEVRTFITIVLNAAPLLIDVEVSRRLLEQSQRLIAELVGALQTVGQDPSAAAAARGRVDAAVDGLRSASDPLLQLLNAQERAAAAG
ncbi:MAG TPA: hypothetical protein VGF64_04935 [Acidimicrobiales bacterium]